MKTRVIFISAIFLFVIIGKVSTAQVSINAQATAEVIQSLTVTEGTALNFGRFSPESSGGEVRLSPDGVRSSTGSVVLGGGLYNPATFFLSGQPDYAVNISLPDGPVMLTNSASGQTMEITDWESSIASLSEINLPTNGLLNLSIGATLRVGVMSENPVGIYSGTYTITFSYN